MAAINEYVKTFAVYSIIPILNYAFEAIRKQHLQSSDTQNLLRPSRISEMHETRGTLPKCPGQTQLGEPYKDYPIQQTPIPYEPHQSSLTSAAALDVSVPSKPIKPPENRPY